MNAALTRKVLTLAGLLALAAPTLPATTIVWGGTSGVDWDAGTSWTGGVKPTTPDVASFAAGANTVANVVADQAVTSISFSTASVGNTTVGSTGGNKLTLTSSGSISIVNTVTTASTVETINAPLVLAPTSASGNGAYSFSNAATTTTVALAIGGSVSGGTTTGSVVLTLTGANTGANNNVSGLISDGGAAGGLSIVKASSGKWVLSNANNSFTGGVSINSGTITTASLGMTGFNSALGTNGTIKVGSQGSTTLLYTGTGETSDKNIILQGTNGLGLYSSGTGAITISGNISSTTAVAANNNLQIRGSGGNLTSPNVLAGVISEGAGALSIIKGDANTWALTGANTYTGNTTINGGTVLVGNGGATGNLGAGNVINPSGTLGFDRNNALSVANVISGAGQVQQIGTGTTTLTGSSTYTGITTITAGTLSVGTIGNGGVASSNLGSATNAATSLVFNGGALQYTGVDASTDRNFTINAGKTATFDISANNLTLTGNSTATAGSFTKIGSGTLTLNGTNLYTGTTTVSAGTLAVNGSIAASSGVSMADSTSLSGTGTVGAVTLAGNNSLSSAGTLTTGTITVGGTGNTLGSGSVTGLASVNSGADFSVTSGATLGSASVNGLLTNNGTISGAVGINSGGALHGAGLFSSDVTIASGGMLAPGASSLPTFTTNLTLGGTTQLGIAGLGRGTAYSALNVGGTLTYGGDLHVTFGAPVTDGVYGLFSFLDGTSVPTTSGTFGNVVFDGSGYDATLVYLAGLWQATGVNGHDFSFSEATGALTVSPSSPVPEPATYAAILGGIALLGAVVRRRQKK